MVKVTIGSQKAVREIGNKFRTESRNAARDFKPKSARNKYKSYLSQVITKTFTLLQMNVLVNGNTWDPTLRDEDEEIEPRDRKILQQLKDKQLAVQEQIEAVVKHRKETRKQVLGDVQNHLQDLAPPVFIAAVLDKDDEERPKKESNGDVPFDMAAAVQSFQDIATLTKDLPALVNSYNKLHEIIQTQDRLKDSSVEKALREESAATSAPLLQQLRPKP